MKDPGGISPYQKIVIPVLYQACPSADRSGNDNMAYCFERNNVACCRNWL